MDEQKNRGMAGWTDRDGWVNRWGEQITYLFDFFIHLSIYPIYYLFIQYISLLPCLFVYSVFSLSVGLSLSVIYRSVLVFFFLDCPMPQTMALAHQFCLCQTTLKTSYSNVCLSCWAFCLFACFCPLICWSVSSVQSIPVYLGILIFGQSPAHPSIFWPQFLFLSPPLQSRTPVFFLNFLCAGENLE